MIVSETEMKSLQTQEDLQVALMKIIGPQGSVFINRDLQCVFDGNDFKNKEKWSVYARRDTGEGGQIVISMDQLPDAQTAYVEVTKQFKRIDDAGIGASRPDHQS